MTDCRYNFQQPLHAWCQPIINVAYPEIRGIYWYWQKTFVNNFGKFMTYLVSPGILFSFPFFFQLLWINSFRALFEHRKQGLPMKYCSCSEKVPCPSPCLSILPSNISDSIKQGLLPHALLSHIVKSFQYSNVFNSTSKSHCSSQLVLYLWREKDSHSDRIICWKGPSKVISSNPPAMNRYICSLNRCSEPCPAWTWVFPRTRFPSPLWATWSSTWPLF